MASIERTAYPRFQLIPQARDLTESFTPTTEEIEFGSTLVQRPAAVLSVLLLLKCAQYLGYFPALHAIPAAIVTHVRFCLRFPTVLEPLTFPPRTLRRHERALRTSLGLQPAHSHAARRLAIQTVAEAARVLAHPVDLINVAVEQSRRHAYELPSFPTLDRLVQRVRTVVHGQLFAQVLGHLTPTAIADLDRLLTTTDINARHTAFQQLKDVPKKPSLTHLDLLLEHLTWLWRCP